MRRGLVRVVSLLLMAALLAVLPGIVGCGADSGAGTKEIVLGFQSDLTGPASGAVIDLYKGFVDYLSMQQDLLQGLRTKIITWDTRSDATRNIPGYMWLKGQGAQLMIYLAGVDRLLLADDFAKDEMPAIGSQGVETLQGHSWTWSLMATPEVQGETAMQFVLDNWKGTGKPKVGHAGISAFYISAATQRGIDRFMENHPGELDWQGYEKGPYGNTAWAVEVSKLKRCDYIYCSMVGPGTASFVNQARAGGYTGKLLSGIEAFPGFWHMVRAVVPADQLYGCYYAHYMAWWSDPAPFITEQKEWLEKHRPGEAEDLMARTGYPSGWALALWLTDALVRAIEAVGVDLVDKYAIRDALVTTDLEVPGWGNVWRVTPDNNICAWAQRFYMWDIPTSDWIAASGWITPSPNVQ